MRRVVGMDPMTDQDGNQGTSVSEDLNPNHQYRRSEETVP